MNLPPYSFAQAFSAWHFDAVTAVFVVLAGAFYGWRVRRAAKQGMRWPWWRAALFVVLGLGGVVICTMSSLAVYQHAVPAAFVVQVALLLSVVPVALAAGDPMGLLRAGSPPDSRERLDRVLRGRVARVLTFPVVAAVLGVVVQLVLFFGPVLKPALEHSWLMNLVYLVVLFTGCLLAWPLLGEDLLPSWCSPPLRMLFAALDGLLDAIPGIALIAASSLIAGGYFRDHAPAWSSGAHADQQVAGTLAVAVAEVVAIPLLAMLFFQWARDDMRRDAVALQARPTSGGSGGAATMVDAQDPGSASEEPVLERPWWETDPGFGRRTEEYRGRGPGS